MLCFVKLDKTMFFRYNRGMMYLAAYLSAVSLLAIVLTVVDKHRATHRRRTQRLRRIPERTLLLVAALGGAVAMLITMRIIRHKTRHGKFTLGLPGIIVLQMIAAILVWRAFA
jgi:uncharacterized membrane protein YsdA (DUF1294 family)